MRYVLRQKLFSIGGDFLIQDGHGRDVYFVDGKAISLGRRLEIKDLQGNGLATIQQRLISLTPAYEISLRNGPSATISRRFFSPIFDRLKVDLPGWDDYEVRGDLFDHEYVFYRGGREVTVASKRWIALTDSYGLDIAEGENDLLILASAVVIDEMIDARDRRD